jgi:hypothetical protein
MEAEMSEKTKDQIGYVIVTFVVGGLMTFCMFAGSFHASP